MIAAVIPTRYHPPELDVLLAQLAADGVTPIVLESDNHDHRIYRMWNVGAQIAWEIGATQIAILNDDIRILPGTLPLLASLLTDDVGIVYPDIATPLFAGLPTAPELTSTTGTFGAGGMTGFAFMFRSDVARRLPFDEAYHWWYGDDACEEQTRALGYRVCRAEGVPIGHTANGSASKRWDELAPLIAQDRARWEAAHA